MTTPTRDIRPPASLQDVMTATGLGRESVKALIRTGQLPGHKLGRRYVIPRDAFDAFCAGDWEPRSQPIQPLSLIRRREAS